MWRLPVGDADDANRWAQIKSGFSRRLPSGEWRSRRRLASRERGLWQRRYWEHLIRDQDDFRHHLDYIHDNPVKHGHVRMAADWPYSSFRKWVALGAYSLEWGGR